MSETFISVPSSTLRAAERVICLAIEYAEMAEHEVIMGKAHVRYLRVVKADIAEMREARALLLREIEAPWPKQP